MRVTGEESWNRAADGLRPALLSAKPWNLQTCITVIWRFRVIDLGTNYQSKSCMEIH